MTAAQSIDLRAPLTPGVGTGAAWRCVREVVPTLEVDRVLYGDIEALAVLIRDGVLERRVRTALAPAELI
jgi:histidine ammonia-lyase